MGKLSVSLWANSERTNLLANQAYPGVNHRMAWRIDSQVIRGELDNRKRGRVVGKIWFVGLPESVVLELQGNPWRDLAGCQLSFTNPNPTAGDMEHFAAEQIGKVGDITASRKVKVPDIPIDEVVEYYAAKKPFPWHWGNALYLEWHSKRNGRVVIETTDFELEISPERTWQMTEEEELEQCRANQNAMFEFLARFEGALPDDASQSEAEADAMAESERMNLLLDRVFARMEREQLEAEDWERVYEEERAKMYDEFQTTGLENDSAIDWEPLLSAAEEAASYGEDEPVERRHPLAERCLELAFVTRRELSSHPDFQAIAESEHPALLLAESTSLAAAKLAGALNGEWPVELEFAGDTLVRLKKARSCLMDANHALEFLDAEHHGDPLWRQTAKREITALLDAVNQLVDDLRERLANRDTQ